MDEFSLYLDASDKKTCVLFDFTQPEWTSHWERLHNVTSDLPYIDDNLTAFELYAVAGVFYEILYFKCKIFINLKTLLHSIKL